LVNLLPAFHPQPVLVSDDEMVSCKQQIVGSSFLIQFAKLCLLMGELSPLTFSVSIDRYVVISVIMLSLLFKGLIVCS
jgi:predicted ABC-type exoprotein transport system permease subunit